MRYVGSDYYKSLCQHLDAAKKRIWMEMYIFDETTTCRKFVDSLIAASKRGCDVVVLLDYVSIHFI